MLARQSGQQPYLRPYVMSDPPGRLSGTILDENISRHVVVARGVRQTVANEEAPYEPTKQGAPVATHVPALDVRPRCQSSDIWSIVTATNRRAPFAHPFLSEVP